MCGITGIWNRTGRPANSAWLERMMDRLAHRGPDDRRMWIDGAIALGHLRLSIIDLSPHARQPFVTADSERVLVYNGEVYNYLELRRQLEDEGVRFTSASDSEVVLYALHLPRLAKYRNGHGKWVLKSVASKRLPRDVVYAPKLGFHVPYDPFASAVGLLQDGAARDLFQWSAGTTRRVMQLVQPDSFAAFQLLSLELWARLFLRGESYDALGETLVRLAASRGPA